MKKQKSLYEDVVVGGEPSKQNSHPDSGKNQAASDRESGSKKQHSESAETTSGSEETERTPDEARDKKNGTEGKDEKPHSAMEKRAEKLAEDPYATDAEMKTLANAGDTKEKEEQVQKESKNNKKGKEDPRKKEAEESKKDLHIVKSRADKILFQAKSIFPIDFFPNTVTIDANKVNIIIGTFFWTETVTSILLKEIMDVRVESTLFLGKLIIDYGPHPLKIRTVYVSSMWRKDALKAKEIIEGQLVLYRSENIDTTRLKPEETIEEIREIGKFDEEHRVD